MGYFPFCFNRRNFWKYFHGHLILASLDWWRRGIGWCYCGALMRIVFYSLYTWQKVKMFSLWDQTKGKVDPVDPKEKGTWILGASRSVDDAVSIKPPILLPIKNCWLSIRYISFHARPLCFLIFVMELDILIILYSANVKWSMERSWLAQNKRDIKGEKEKHRTQTNFGFFLLQRNRNPNGYHYNI